MGQETRWAVGLGLQAALLAGGGDPGARASYLAHVAAASHALRGGDVAETRRWLKGAPASFRGFEWGYLANQADQASFTWAVSAEPVTSVAVGGPFVATAASDGKVRVHRGSDGRELSCFADAGKPPQAVALSAEGRSLAAAYPGHRIRLWDLASGQERPALQGAGKGLTALAFSPDGRLLATTSWNREASRGVWGLVEVFDVASGACLQKLEYGEKPLVAVAFSPDGRVLAAGSWENQHTVVAWEVEGWRGPLLFESEDDGVYKAFQAVAFSPDGKFLAAVGKDSAVRLWEVATRKRLLTLGGRGQGHTKWVNGVAFSPDGRRLATVSTDRTLRFWNTATGAEEGLRRGHASTLHGVAFRPGGKEVLTVAGDGQLKGWAVPEASAEPGTWRLSESPFGVAAGPGVAVSVAWKGGLQKWDLATGRPLGEVKAHEGSANAVALSGDALTVATVGNDGAVRTWHLEDLGEGRRLEAVKGLQLTSVALDHAGRRLLAPSGGGEAKLWDALDGRLLGTLIHPGGVSAVGMGRGGQVLATGGRDGSILVWDSAGRRILATFAPRPGNPVGSLALSPDGRWLAAASGRFLSLIHLPSRRLRRVLAAHDEAISGVAFSPDGRRLASASADQTVGLWEVGTWEKVLTVPFEAWAYALAFTPEGDRLLVALTNREVRVLDAR